MVDVAEYPQIYADLRGRVIELVTAAPADRLEARAPAAPEWTAREVLCHLVGVTHDVLVGNLDGVATDAWTRAQVDARRTATVEELVEEWCVNALQIDPIIPSFGAVAGQFIGDAVTHEHDLRGALNRPGARESRAIAAGFEWMGSLIGSARTERGAGALQLDTEAGTATLGEGEPTATIKTTRFELARAATGRRSLAQMQAWGSTGDVRPELLVLGIFEPRADDLIE